MCTCRKEEKEKSHPLGPNMGQPNYIRELCDSTFDLVLCEVHYYLLLIIAHSVNRTLEMHERTLKGFWASLKALRSISLETFLLRQRAGCEWV